MKQPKVSIIIPIYNSGQYLEKCLDTLVRQTLREIEIILVLDCPTDGSDKIAERYAAQDNRIKIVYNSKNLHTGLSSNVGLEIATGEYIGFVDHDDYSDLYKYEKLYQKAIDDNLDMVRCCFYIQEGDKIVKSKQLQDFNNVEELKKYLIENFLRKTAGFGNNWCWIYRTSMIKKYALKFVDSKITAGQDGLFTLETLLTADKIGLIFDYLCYYRMNDQSVSHNKKLSIKNYLSYQSSISLCENILFLLHKKECDTLYKSALLEGIPKFLYSAFYNGFRDSFSVGLQGVRLIAKNKTFVKLFSNLFQCKNLPILFRLKPTIIVFLLLVIIVSLPLSNEPT